MKMSTPVSKQKKVLVIGSGFHKEISTEKSILSDWNLLLKSIDPKIISERNQTLAFEEMIIRKTTADGIKKRRASEIEKVILREISKNIKTTQGKILFEEILAKYRYLFDYESVSDIISLNFDTTLEELCLMHAKNLGSKIKTAKKKIHYKSEKIVVMSYDIEFPNKNIIRFWYPHGSIKNYNSISIGVRSYYKRMADVEELRKLSKSKKRVVSWYHQFTHNPVIVIGASLSILEWDFWFAIVNRERNFAKQSNKKFKSDISMSSISMSDEQTTNFWLHKSSDSTAYWSSIQKIIQSNTKR